MSKVTLANSKYNITNKTKFGYEVTLSNTKDFVVKQCFLFGSNCSKYGESSKGSRTFKVISGKLYMTYQADQVKDSKELRVNDSITIDSKTPYMFSTGRDDCEFMLIESADYAKNFKVLENTEITAFKNNFNFSTEQTERVAHQANERRAPSEAAKKAAIQLQAQKDEHLRDLANPKSKKNKTTTRNGDSNFSTGLNPMPSGESLLMDD